MVTLVFLLAAGAKILSRAAIVTFGVIVLGGCAPTDFCSGARARELAYEASHTFVRSQLKAPATAVFPAFDDEEVVAIDEGQCRFKVWGYVDSQNSFGALIRTTYAAELTADQSGNYTPVSVRVF